MYLCDFYNCNFDSILHKEVKIKNLIIKFNMYLKF